MDIDTRWVHETPTEAKVECDIRTGNVSIEPCHTEGGEIDANALAAKIALDATLLQPRPSEEEAM